MEEKAPRFWRRWWRFVAARVGVAAIVLLLLVPLFVLSLAPPSRPAEEEPPPWWHDLDGVRVIIPEHFYEDHAWRPQITPDDVTFRDCAMKRRVLRSEVEYSEARRRLLERHCPEL